jgi:hypothetical protein
MWNLSRTADAKKMEQKVLNWQDLQHAPAEQTEFSAPTIASCLRRLLEKYEESEFIKYLVAPSPTALSGFFHCDEAEIYQALQELERQGYATETSGDLGPILLWDPLIRRKTIRHHEPNAWQLFSDMLRPSPHKSAAS